MGFTLMRLKRDLSELDLFYKEVGVMDEEKYKTERLDLVGRIKACRLVTKHQQLNSVVWAFLERLSRDKYLFPSDVDRIKKSVCKKIWADPYRYSMPSAPWGMIKGEDPLFGYETDREMIEELEQIINKRELNRTGGFIELEIFTFLIKHKDKLWRQ